MRCATAEDAQGIARVQVRSWQMGYRGIVADEYLATFEVDAFHDRWLKLLDETSSTFLVAEDDDVIVGFAGYDRNGDGLGDGVGELNGLYVEPDCWGRGIGSALILEVHCGLVAGGFTEAILWTLEKNERTRRFYERHRWTPDGATKVHRSGAPLVRLRRPLPSSGWL